MMSCIPAYYKRLVTRDKNVHFNEFGNVLCFENGVQWDFNIMLLLIQNKNVLGVQISTLDIQMIIPTLLGPDIYMEVL